jgi:GNAT superfamily N-acetyltransferase
MAHETTDGSFTLSDDPARFDVARAHRWIGQESYWAQGIPLATFARACANSLIIGAYAGDGTMVAMARVVTDRATFGWLCDVFVYEAHRADGLGKRLMRYFRAHRTCRASGACTSPPATPMASMRSSASAG